MGYARGMRDDAKPTAPAHPDDEWPTPAPPRDLEAEVAALIDDLYADPVLGPMLAGKPRRPLPPRR